jgi:hypothetical protein
MGGAAIGGLCSVGCAIGAELSAERKLRHVHREFHSQAVSARRSCARQVDASGWAKDDVLTD